MHHEIWHERLWAFACISCGPRPEALVIDGIAMGLQVQELNKYKEEFCIDQRYALQIFAVILAQRSKYHKYWRKYLRRKKRKYMHRKYLRKYWRNAQNTANIGAYICGEKSENICTANICAIICDNIGATLQIPHILAQIFAAKKAKIYPPQIFAQLFTGKKANKTYGSLP